MPIALLPADALARWRALDLPASSTDPVARTLVWIARLRARMLVSGGRLARILVAAGLCTIEDLLACVHAQLDESWPNPLGYDISSDLFAIASLAPLDSLEQLSARLAGIETFGATFDHLHTELAQRLLACGREHEAEAALARVEWHLALISLLEEHGSKLTPALRDRLCERAGELVEDSYLPVVHHVGPYARLAVINHDPRWLARARACLVAVPPEQLEASPDYAHPVEDIAWALAQLGKFEHAMALLARLDPRARWTALVRLLPHASDPTTRAEILDELVASVEPLELPWWCLLQSVPEATPRALARLWALDDDAKRFEELATAAPYLQRDHAEPVCAWLLSYAREHALVDDASAMIWGDTLDALHECGCAALIDEDERRTLIDQLLAKPELSVWYGAAPIVPDDRVIPVLELAEARLVLANHYIEREQWIEVALAVLDRAPAELVDRWRARSVDAVVRTAIEDRRYGALSAWADQRDAIILGRLAQHQHEFLPKQLIQPRLVELGWELPHRVLARVPAVLEQIPADVRAHQLERPDFAIEAVEDEEERARYVAYLDDLLEQPGWPRRERVLWVFVLLARIAGEAAVVEALSVLAASR